MIRSSVKTIYVEKPIKTRVCQGDIYRDIMFHYSEYNSTKLQIEAKKRKIPYLVVLSQDCDLEEDYNCRSEDKKTTQIIESLLVCPAFQSEKFKEGTYLKNFDVNRGPIEEKDFDKKYKSNNHQYRFHYLEKGGGDFQIPSLVLDFKWFYTIPRNFFYIVYLDKHYLGTLDELFRESLSVRFANYLSRIGLPVISDK